MARSLPEYLDKAIDRTRLAEVARRFKLDLIVLFGSHARGDARPDSDVDIAVRTRFGTRSGDPEWLAGVRAGLSQAIPGQLRLCVLDDEPTSFMVQVAGEGIPLHETEGDEFILFTLYAQHLHEDESIRQMFLEAEWTGDYSKLPEWAQTRRSATEEGLDTTCLGDAEEPTVDDS
jgi:predicted nucleotidyltransferase